MEVTQEQIHDVVRSVYFDQLMMYKRAQMLYKRRENDIDKYPEGYAKYEYKTVEFGRGKIIKSEKDSAEFFNQFREAINEAENIMKTSNNILNYIYVDATDGLNKITLEMIKLVPKETFYSMLDDEIFDALHQKFGSAALEDENLSQEIKSSVFYKWFNGNIPVELFLQELKILKD